MRLQFSRSTASIVVSVVLLLICAPSARCQTSAPPPFDEDEELFNQLFEPEASNRFTLYQRFEVSSNSLGQVFGVTTNAGFDLGRHFGVDFGLPVYFVRSLPVLSSVNATGGTGSGIGNFYGDLRFALNRRALDYSTTITLAAPTGTTRDGNSTGHFTYYWDNRFERNLRRFTPFVEVGLSNTVQDTRAFNRAFTTLGNAGHLEAGTRFTLWRSLSLSASLYDVLPWGPQTIYYRRIKYKTRSGKIAYRTSKVVVGGPELARDNGLSLGFDTPLRRGMDLSVGCTHSTHLHIDTVFVSVAYDLRSLLSRLRPK